MRNKLSFKGNNSFYIRSGWIEKGIHAIVEHPGVNIFDKVKGREILGIGANMVKALEYWMRASNLIEGKSDEIELSELGRLICNFDPYMESLFSWYLVHYFLTINIESNPIGYVIFNSHVLSLTTDNNETVKFICEYLKRKGYELNMEDKKLMERIESDLEVFYKSYTNEHLKDRIIDPEENLKCPLANLGLLTTYNILSNKKGYYKHPTCCLSGNLLDLNYNHLITYYAICELYKGKNSFIIEDLMEEEQSPIAIFNLRKGDLYEHLRKCQIDGLCTINTTAGLNVAYIEKSINLSDIYKAKYRLRWDSYKCGMRDKKAKDSKIEKYEQLTLF